MTESQGSATVCPMWSEISAQSARRTTGRSPVEKAVSSVPAIPWVRIRQPTVGNFSQLLPVQAPPARSATSSRASVTAGRASEAGSATSARTTSGATPGWSVNPATVTPVEFTRTKLSATPAPASASVCRVTPACQCEIWVL